MTHLVAKDITVILLSLAVLLAAARLLGELMQRFRQPAVIGEILAGVILGQTVLGNVWPSAMAHLFPAAGAPPIVLEGIRTVAVVLFLLVAGMEVDLSSIFRQGKAALSVSIAGIVAPLVLGLSAALLAPRFFGQQQHIHLWVFAMFFATAMAISALPVIAKTLMDLNLYRSDFGMVVVAAAIFDDLVGWFIFAVVLSMINPDGPKVMWVGGTIGLTVVFTLFMLTIGRWLIHAVLPWIQAHASWPGGVLGFAAALALAGAAFTEWIGIHAVFGSFLIGVALGDSVHLRERTRTTLEQFVSFIFAPFFFASIGLRVDFIANFDILLVVAVLLIACASKVIGCGLGARWAGLPWRESLAIGFGMNSRGAMEIILGTLALQYRVIDERMFVALVVMAMVTSMLSGTMMQWILRRPLPRRFADYLHPRGFINPLQSTEREGAVHELAQAAAAITGLKPEAIEHAVLQRERMMPTGLGLCVAVPHARLHGLNKPVVCLGLSREGIEFDAPDGERSRMIFMILTPSEDHSGQLEILADISRTFLNQALREGGLRVSSFNEFLALLRTRETGTVATRLGG